MNQLLRKACRNLRTKKIILRKRLGENSTPLAVFFITRLGLFILVYLSLVLLPMNKEPVAWQAFPQNLFLDGWLRWDAGWFKNIAQRGYLNIPLNLESMQGQRDTAFFPLYPLLIRLLTSILGNTFISGLIISNLSFLMALITLFHLVRKHYSLKIAQRSIILLALYPFSFYFNSMYSESLFLFLTLLAFYFAEEKRWVLSGLSAALTGATRAVGTLLVPSLIVLYFEKINFNFKKSHTNLLWLLLGLLGIINFMLFLHLRFSDPFLFLKSHQVQGWSKDIGTKLASDTLKTLLSLQAIAAGYYAGMNLVHLVILPLALILIFWGWSQPRISYSLWALLMILVSTLEWTSMGRYLAVIFPLFITSALLFKRKFYYQIVVYLSILILALFTIMFAHFYWVA